MLLPKSFYPDYSLRAAGSQFLFVFQTHRIFYLVYFPLNRKFAKFFAA